MFRGTQFLSLDAKGRLAVPSRQRERLERLCDSRLVITAHPQRCLLIYPEPEFVELERRLNEMPAHMPNVAPLQRLVIGYANEVEPDAQGRVLLTPAQRRFATLDKRVALVGMVNRFELWDEDAWNATIAEAEAVDLQGLAANPDTASFKF